MPLQHPSILFRLLQLQSFVGLDEMVTKIQGGWTDFDVVVATPNVMAAVGKIGRILGPRGLMPNPKTGTVTPNVGAAVADVKGGKISFRVDKFGIIHSSIGRVSFSADQLVANAFSIKNCRYCEWARVPASPPPLAAAIFSIERRLANAAAWLRLS